MKTLVTTFFQVVVPTFVPTFVRSFVRSSVRTFVRSFVRTSVPMVVLSLVLSLCLMFASACATDPPASNAPSSGFGGIPQIDLSRDTSRQVVVDRERGQYLGHPTTVLLEDGQTLLAVYPKGHGRGAIIYKRSNDGGLTWSERLPTPDNWSTSAEVPTLYRLAGPDGDKRLVMFSGLYPIRSAVSNDDGVTWSPLEPIGDYGGIVAMASVAELSDGRHAAFFHDDGRFLRDAGERSAFTVFKTISEDGGLTWGEPIAIASSDSLDLCEPGLVWSPDGSEMALLLRENSRTANSHVIFSRDDGETWTEPTPLPEALTGDRHTAVYLDDGRLFVSFRDMGHDSETKGDWVAWVGEYEDLRRGSPEAFRIRVMDNKNSWDAAYPGVVRLLDGTVVTTTYGHWDEGEEPYIVSVRLKIDEIERSFGLNR